MPTIPTRILSATVEETGGIYLFTFEHAITGTHRYAATATPQRLVPLDIQAYTPSDILSPTNGADYLIITHADFYTDVLPLAVRVEVRGVEPRLLMLSSAIPYQTSSQGLGFAIGLYHYVSRNHVPYGCSHGCSWR